MAETRLFRRLPTCAGHRAKSRGFHYDPNVVGLHVGVRHACHARRVACRVQCSPGMSNSKTTPRPSVERASHRLVALGQGDDVGVTDRLTADECAELGAYVATLMRKARPLATDKAEA